MTAQDYHGLGFAIGSVNGLRSFDVDSLGRLRGVYVHAVWKPGENQAVCDREKLSRGKHDMESCNCGFYAFYNGEDSYNEPGRISGVVEGYGETVIGTRGFRAKKAKVLALHVPTRSKLPLHPKYWPGVRLAYEYDLEIGCMVMGTMFSVMTLIGSIMGAVAGSVLWAVILGLLTIVLAYVATIGFAAEYGGTPTKVKALSRETIAKIKHNYPEVEFFTSKRAMLAKYPVEDHTYSLAKATPETREDFWEVEVPV